MDIESATSGFTAVGSVPRMQVLNLLVRAGDSGLTITQIGEKSGLKASTLAHHLKALADGGVITQHKQGRSVVNKAQFARLASLAAYLLDECCADSGDET